MRSYGASKARHPSKTGKVKTKATSRRHKGQHADARSRASDQLAQSPMRCVCCRHHFAGKNPYAPEQAEEIRSASQ
jgi:hypothetical protein